MDKTKEEARKNCGNNIGTIWQSKRDKTEEHMGDTWELQGNMRTCGKADAIKLRNKCEELVGTGEGATDKVYKINVMN
jgi:hypothetical protein